MSFKIRHLALAIATVSPIVANAAGLDRSTQPSWAFTQDGTFAYIEHINIDPKVKGKDSSGNKVSDMADDYHFLNYGAKADINDRVSVGVFFDQPWGADASYTGNNNFVAQATSDQTITAIAANIANQLKSDPATAPLAPIVQSITTVSRAKSLLPLAPANLRPVLQGAIAAAENADAIKGEGTSVKVKSQNFSGVVGLKFGDKNQFQVYGGPALEKLEGEVHLRGTAYNSATGYDASIPSNTAYGWLAGVAYSKPEIALKAALTYRSEIDHEVKLAEKLPLAPLRGIDALQTNKNTITMPKSVNIDFQTGLNPTTLLTAKVRWVPWSDFNITPQAYTNLTKKAVDANGKQLYPKGLPLVKYDDDAWTAEVGIGKKLSPKWAVSGSVGWDSGAGNPVTTLGPVEGNWNVGLGAKYNITPEWAVSAGAKYLMLGDAKAKVPTDNIVGDFQNNDAWVYGLRLTYQKK